MQQKANESNLSISKRTKAHLKNNKVESPTHKCWHVINSRTRIGCDTLERLKELQIKHPVN